MPMFSLGIYFSIIHVFLAGEGSYVSYTSEHVCDEFGKYPILVHLFVLAYIILSFNNMSAVE